MATPLTFFFFPVLSTHRQVVRPVYQSTEKKIYWSIEFDSVGIVETV